MKPQINQVGIITNNFEKMSKFYQEVLGFEPIFEAENHVEFANDGVRFAISTNEVMSKITKHDSFNQSPQGQRFELAFLIESPEKVDTTYKELIEKGATPIQPAADMPWGQRTAFFADPDGNIHEIFANLKS